MADSHVEVFFGLVRMRDFGPRMLSHLERRLNHVAFGLFDLGMLELTGKTDAHRIVGRSELNHVDAFDRKNGFQIFDRRRLFDHDAR